MRTGVVTSLLAATVVIPVTMGTPVMGGAMGSMLGQVEYPTTVSALSAQSIGGQVPAALSPAGAIDDRRMAAASRGMDRDDVLPGCDGLPPAKLSPNGKMPDSDMCTLWGGRIKVRADYAVALTLFNQAYVAKYGVDMCVTSGYRTLSEQYAVKARKGSMAATPGTSNHGLGLAVDFCQSTYSGSRYQWMRDNGPKFGIDNPKWARPGGSKTEMWHWEFTAAVERDNSLHGNTANLR